ncbi:hypothetical protein KAU11_10250 [Candidatus Babeliales bacterium]|nr:hypothetical protein [Candidatus Babeliales bacterium]
MNQQNNHKQKERDLFPNQRNWLDIEGGLETVTTAPTTSDRPRKMSEAVKIYVDSISSPTVMRLYTFSRESNTWGYSTLTIVT